MQAEPGKLLHVDKRKHADLIKLIHVAKRKLGLDDDTYRAALAGVVPGKTSCRDMSIRELDRVLDSLKAKGFKRTRPASPKSPAVVTDKIRIIWNVMHNQGFITDNSPAALDAFVKRITNRKNGGEGVARLAWLRGAQASGVLESLKRWHMRCMLEHLPDIGVKPVYERVFERYKEAHRQAD